MANLKINKDSFPHVFFLFEKACSSNCKTKISFFLPFPPSRWTFKRPSNKEEKPESRVIRKRVFGEGSIYVYHLPKGMIDELKD